MKIFKSVKNVALMGLFAIAVGCSSSQLPKREMSNELSEKYATARDRIVDHVQYDLSFDLTKGKKEYEGEVDIYFNLKTKSRLTIDFREGRVAAVTVNGRRTTDFEYNKKFISLPETFLQQGRNQVTVKFAHPYSRDGAGLYRFEDTEDGRSYVYTDFEPYDANRLFPLFDQPDLKARYQVNVKAPKDWIVITSVKESEVKKGRDYKSWTFPLSQKFSSYIFSLHAGPYKVWTDKVGNVPLRLLARRSLAKYVPHKHFMKITKQGFKFFDEYFDYPYPFVKYDQLFVPDFNSGAMENVAAVTYTERYIKRGGATRRELMRMSNTVIHELAHMWFGNLVTMKWWDDLWLNESFASYMAYLMLAEGTEYTDSWIYFYSKLKGWAYWEDQLVTTHPIMGEVKDTGQAFAIFDGITYGKGASSLKQLDYYLGGNNFRDGVRAYFKKYAYKNTKLKDFIGSLSEASKVDLDRWSKLWLTTSSVNTLEAKYQCADGKVSQFEVLQTAQDGFKTLRPHKVQIGLFNKKNGRIELSRAQAVHIDGEKTIVGDLVGADCPDLVYPNYGDYGYVKAKLDAKSLALIESDIHRVKDTLARLMLGETVWHMTEAAQYSMKDYLKFAINALEHETEESLVDAITYNVTRWGKNYWPYEGEATEEARSWRKDAVKKLEALFWKKLRTEKNIDFKRRWFQAYVDVAETRIAQNRFLNVLQKNWRLGGLKVDQDRRWSIVKRLSALGHPLSAKLIQAERKRDSSSRGKKSLLSAQVIAPNFTKKQELISSVLKEKSRYSFSEAKSILRSAFPSHQRALKVQNQSFYEDLLAISKVDDSRTIEFARLVPLNCDSAANDRLSQFLSTEPKLPFKALKRLKVRRQEDQKCMRIHKRSF